MPDEVNFLPEKSKKKHGNTAAGAIEYTEGEKNEPQVNVPSLAEVQKNVEESVEKTRQSFLEWRTARKQKREEDRKRKAEQQAQAAKDHATKKALEDKAAEEKRIREVHEKAVAQPKVAEAPHQASAVPVRSTPPIEVKEKTSRHLEPVLKKPEPAQPLITAPIAHHLAPKKQHTTTTEQNAADTGDAAPEKNEAITSVNLIPASLFEAMRSQNRFRDLIVIAGLMCALVMMVFTGLHVYAQKLSRDTHDVVLEIQALDTKIDSYEAIRGTAQLQYDQLSAVSDILDGHIQWTPFFAYLEKWTLPSVYYETMSGSAATGDFTFNVVTSDFRFVTAQIEVLRRSPLIASVTTTSATQDSVGSEEDTNTNSNTNAAQAGTGYVVRFTMTVQFKPGLFHSSNTN